MRPSRQPCPTTTPRSTPRVAAVVVAVVAGVVVTAVTTASTTVGDHDPTSTPVVGGHRAAASGGGGPTSAVPAVSSVASPSRLRRARAVLEHWDERRAAAWRGGAAAELEALYVPGSRAGRRDVAMLRRWTARGLRVDRLEVQVLGLEVLRAEPGRWVLRVADRVASARAVTADGALPPVDLPRDGADRRRIDLRRVDGAWRVWSVLRTDLR